MSKSEITFCFTVDTDSDQFFGDRFDSRSHCGKQPLGWSNLDEGLAPLIQSIADVRDSFGNPLAITWFVRCDEQIKSIHDDHCYLLKKYDSWWNKRLDAGDELQWHAHLYTLSENDLWVQAESPEDLKHDLTTSHAALANYGFHPKAVRIGEAYQSNPLMDILETLGIEADCSSMPGRKRDDAEKLLDWSVTPNHPYRPSRDDYRVPGEPGRRIWEIPMNTVATQVSYDKAPLLRYVNPAFNKGILDKGVAEFLCNNDMLTSITHPFEILPRFFSDSRTEQHPLLAFDKNALAHNLKTIVQSAESMGKKIRFATVGTLMEELGSRK